MQAHVPKDVGEAIMLAKVQQQVLEKGKQKWSKSAVTNRFQTGPHKGDAKNMGQQSTLRKERQTLNYRKANNLCYYCGDLDIPLSEEIVAQLELEDSLTSEFCQLSLNALAGTDQGDAMKIRALVKNQVMLTLIDTGNSHSFVSSAFLERVGIKPVPTTPKQVKLANGEVLISDQWVPNMTWWCNGYTLQADMKVLDIATFDGILGYDWLKPNSPMKCHWAQKTMEFEHNGQLVKLQGVQPREQAVHELSADQLVKWWKGNDIWALVVVHQQLEEGVTETPQEVKELLHQYADVFEDPKKLHPSRVYDHTIPLLLDAVPMNSKPYRYSPQHKDEIERQVREMIQSGLVVPSTSPFASPVLLIQKKDGSWRFCVDYHRLNELTVKNRFPMPIMEEILEELPGSKYFAKLDMKSGYHQVRMRPEDEYKTAFKTHQGHYQFRIMPFGLTNAPATFQCLRMKCWLLS